VPPRIYICTVIYYSHLPEGVSLKVRIFLFLFLSLLIFYAQLQARVAVFSAAIELRQPNDSLPEKGTKKKWPVRIAESFINRHAASEIYDSLYCGKWTYEQGMMLEALHQMWLFNHDAKYLTYIKTNVDMFIGGDGSIRTYNYEDFNLENINTGRQLLFLYSLNKNKKYKAAADTLMKQLKNQPRTKSGFFSDKKNCPSKLSLEGLYMYKPFYAQYSRMFRQNKNFNDIARQFILIKEKTLDTKTGLLQNAWDENLQTGGADTITAKAPGFSARAMGSYAMALIDVLDYFPKNHPKRKELVKILRELSEALLKARDENSLWYEAVGQGVQNDSYLEASSNYMIAYAFAKGANKEYLERKYLKFAKETFIGVAGKFASVDEMGRIDFHKAGGGTALKELGTFLLAAIELEKAEMLRKEDDLFPVKSKITKF
jgi:unsaturated rhamnogalacturonyl hydrolase